MHHLWTMMRASNDYHRSQEAPCRGTPICSTKPTFPETSHAPLEVEQPTLVARKLPSLHGDLDHLDIDDVRVNQCSGYTRWWWLIWGFPQSWGYPFSIYVDEDFPNKNHPAFLAYPHGHGKPNMNPDHWNRWRFQPEHGHQRSGVFGDQIFRASINLLANWQKVCYKSDNHYYLPSLEGLELQIANHQRVILQKHLPLCLRELR